MDYLGLFTSPVAVFGGLQKELQEADYVVVGVPFDPTSTYRPGSRFAPLAIREASLNIETYSFRSRVDLEDLKIHDSGDLHVTGNMDETLKRLEQVSHEILSTSKVPVFIGGEHTMTFGIVRGIPEDFALVSFDAHLDLRNEYMGQRFCHASFMRRIHETVKPVKIVEVGIRAACKEELDYAKTGKIRCLTCLEIMQKGKGTAVGELDRLLGDCQNIYMTIDMDVLDPSVAPAVGNPEPDGLSTHLLLDLISVLCSRRVFAFDLVEASPHYDMGITAVQAAKIIFEVLSHIHKSKEEVR